MVEPGLWRARSYSGGCGFVQLFKFPFLEKQVRKGNLEEGGNSWPIKTRVQIAEGLVEAFLRLEGI